MYYIPAARMYYISTGRGSTRSARNEAEEAGWADRRAGASFRRLLRLADLAEFCVSRARTTARGPNPPTDLARKNFLTPFQTSRAGEARSKKKGPTARPTPLSCNLKRG